MHLDTLLDTTISTVFDATTAKRGSSARSCEVWRGPGVPAMPFGDNSYMAGLFSQPAAATTTRKRRRLPCRPYGLLARRRLGQRRGGGIRTWTHHVRPTRRCVGPLHSLGRDVDALAVHGGVSGGQQECRASRTIAAATAGHCVRRRAVFREPFSQPPFGDK